MILLVVVADRKKERKRERKKDRTKERKKDPVLSSELILSYLRALWLNDP